MRTGTGLDRVHSRRLFQMLEGEILADHNFTVRIFFGF
jgi:hypothetical protein